MSMRKFYLGIGAAIAMGAVAYDAMAQTRPAARTNQPEMRLCTGSPSLRYYRTGTLISEQLRGIVNVNIQPTSGSLDNLAKVMGGECDAALVQSDSFLAFQDQTPNASLRVENVGPIYLEYVHLLCNRESGISKISDLRNNERVRVAVGAPRSGVQATWFALVAKSQAYARVNTVPLAGDLALTRVINGRDAQCMLVVSGIGTEFMKKANELGKGRLVLVRFDDSAFKGITDANGRRIYEEASIPSGTYSNLQDGWFSSAVPTVAVRAEFILSMDWYERNQTTYGDLSTVVGRMGIQQGGLGSR